MIIKLISDKLDEYNEMTKDTYCGGMQKGILLYAREILDAVDDSLDVDSIDTFKMLIINGAKSWREYAMTNSLIWNEDIAKRCLLAEDFCKLTTEEINAQGQKWMGKQVRAIFFAKELLFEMWQQRKNKNGKSLSSLSILRLYSLIWWSKFHYVRHFTFQKDAQLVDGIS